ncbi:callose synthase 9 isoform X2 [Physcomitrium patens]|uniref:1,3-beta-glucan synthase n=1 Tax=Physcomitrium patens TaxID=3218 RepID=A0A7I4DRB0_PHYPA|nr:callose synthase 9-like isoform X2 [Physcomitrium patens]|eukprot:XP_024374293.1 callose synthase 9-like isoform X2 [Physcomitrella patens]
MAPHSHVPHLERRRVVGRWEELVSKAIDAKGKRPFLRLSRGEYEDTVVPQFLQEQNNKISDILQTAHDVENDYPIVARILFEYAYDLSQKMDPKSESRGVLQFKTGLLKAIKLRADGEKTDRSEAISMLQDFYQYLKGHIDRLEDENVSREQRKKYNKTPEEWTELKRKVYITSQILNEVVDYLSPKTNQDVQFDSDLKEDLKKTAEKVNDFKAYNIIPFEAPGVVNPFQYSPEITAAIKSIEFEPSGGHEFGVDFKPPKMRNLDIFDFFQYAFGFQADNVLNQREHLLLLVANAQSRVNNIVKAISNVEEKLLGNYERWCKYVKRVNSTSRKPLDSSPRSMKLFWAALYLLIWGEAANVRFLPECLCYIFHHMAFETYELLNNPFNQKSTILKDSETFLDAIIKPVYEVVAAEAKVCNHGKSPHSSWRNYDDFNEYFWAPSCFELSWPWRLHSGFFVKPMQVSDKVKKFKFRKAQDQMPLLEQNHRSEGEHAMERKAGKSNFVEHRTGFHLYHSFHRLWIFLVCMLQGLAIFAFCDGKLNNANIKYVLSVGPTYFIMKLLQSALDVILMIGAYRSTRYRTVARVWLSLIWFAGFSGIITILYVKTIQEQNSGSGLSTWFRLYCIPLIFYGGSELFIWLFLNMPGLRILAASCSNFGPTRFLKWVHQEQYYVGRGMRESSSDYFSYLVFWAIVLACKFSFSYFLQIKSMVGPTRIIIDLTDINYRWRDIVSKSNHNALTLASLWAPVVMIYFLDLQIWYTVISALVGGFDGARIGLGEIRDLEMLRRRFFSLPSAFTTKLLPHESFQKNSRESVNNDESKVNAMKFAPIWNEVITCLREEDLISNKEKELLLMPNNKVSRTPPLNDLLLIQWPLFLLSNKVFSAIDTVNAYKQSKNKELWDKIKDDRYMMYAVQEAYYSCKNILEYLLVKDQGVLWVKSIFALVEAIKPDEHLNDIFRFNKLTKLLDKVANLTGVLINEAANEVFTVAAVREKLLDLYDMVTRDFVREETNVSVDQQLFSEFSLPTHEFISQVRRLNSILTSKESASEVPVNEEARRRLEFFSNSLFMTMPKSPPVRKMFSFSVFTPYYSEDVIYSIEKLTKPNDDGISIIYYLSTIVPDEWKNFLERQFPNDLEARRIFAKTVLPKKDYKKEKEKSRSLDDLVDEDKNQLRLWASYRGQTLARTVRGMMYYKKALILQAEQESTYGSEDLEQGLHHSTPSSPSDSGVVTARAQAELKFLYVVSAQLYGEQKQSTNPEDRQRATDIKWLMKEYDSLRISYIHKAKVTKRDKTKVYEYYSKLMKGLPDGNDQEIYSIKLPGEVILGEGKPENQNHAIVFTRGEAIQTIDMNQEHYLEETFKMRNLLEEFEIQYGGRFPTILGVREHVFTGSVSSLAWFMSLQERSFVTLGQRVLAKPLKVRMHYGHPDVFDRIFHITRGGISKSSKQINLSEDIFAGFNSTLRLGNITHHEYIQCGKGRDVGLNQIAAFEGKVASGNGEQTLSRDIYRLGHLFDFFRMMSFFFTTVGYYFTTMLTVLTVYVFLYGKVYLALSGVDAQLKIKGLASNVALQSALDTQFLLQIGVFTAVPMIMNFILEEGLLRAITSFFTMQFQLSSVFFTFSLGTRTHYFGRTILHGGAKYASTGRGFVIEHIKYAENYRNYSRTHFVKALEIMLLLIVYLIYGAPERTTFTYILLTFSSWFLAVAWLWAPYIFNPSGFEWQKTVKDFENWTNWMFQQEGQDEKDDKCWEVWWKGQISHIRTLRGRFWEIALSLRFFMVQYGVAYSLNVAGHDKSFRVYGFSWCVLVLIVVLFKVFSLSKKSLANFQLIVRILQLVVFCGVICGLIFTVAFTSLTIGDVFASVLSLIPTGWGLLSIAIALKPVMKKLRLWKFVLAIARLYDVFIGAIVFIPIAFLSWFPFVSTFQTRLVFNQAFSRGLEISTLLAGGNPDVAGNQSQHSKTR